MIPSYDCQTCGDFAKEPCYNVFHRDIEAHLIGKKNFDKYWCEECFIAIFGKVDIELGDKVSLPAYPNDPIFGVCFICCEDLGPQGKVFLIKSKTPRHLGSGPKYHYDCFKNACTESFFKAIT
jgi:hypothetical protein